MRGDLGLDIRGCPQQHQQTLSLLFPYLHLIPLLLLCFQSFPVTALIMHCPTRADFAEAPEMFEDEPVVIQEIEEYEYYEEEILSYCGLS